MTRVTVDSTRHILSTTLTTVGGFLPLILGGGAFWPPLTVVIGGGVALYTSLARVFTPAACRVIAMSRLADRRTGDRSRGETPERSREVRPVPAAA